MDRAKTKAQVAQELREQKEAEARARRNEVYRVTREQTLLADPDYPQVVEYGGKPPCPRCDCIAWPGPSAEVCDSCSCHDMWRQFMGGPR